MDKRVRRWLTYGIVGVVLILIVSAVGIMMKTRQMATVEIMVAPSTAEVWIGENVYSTMEEVRIMPGEYSVVVQAEGFESKTGTLRAVAGQVAEVKLYLEPLDGNEDYYETHAGDALIVGEIKNAFSIAQMEKLHDRWPVLDKLPVEVDYYTEGYASRVYYKVTYVLDDTSFKVVIYDYTGGNYDNALQKLTELGAVVKDGVMVGDEMTVGDDAVSGDDGGVLGSDGEAITIEYVDKTDEMLNGHAG